MHQTLAICPCLPHKPTSPGTWSLLQPPTTKPMVYLRRIKKKIQNLGLSPHVFFFGSSNGRLFSFPNTVVQRLKTTKAPNVTFTFICGAKRFLRFHLLGARQGKEKYRCPLYLDAFHFPNVAPAGSEKASRKVLGVRICNSDHRRATGNATGLAPCRPFMRVNVFLSTNIFLPAKKNCVPN